MLGALEGGCGRYCAGFYRGAFCSVVLHGIFLYSIALRSILRQRAALCGAILCGRAGVLGRLFHMSPRVVGVVWLSVMSCGYREGGFLYL